MLGLNCTEPLGTIRVVSLCILEVSLAIRGISIARLGILLKLEVSIGFDKIRSVYKRPTESTSNTEALFSKLLSISFSLKSGNQTTLQNPKPLHSLLGLPQSQATMTIVISVLSTPPCCPFLEGVILLIYTLT